MDYPSGRQKFKIDSPIRWHTIKQVSRQEYRSAVTNLQKKVQPETMGYSTS